MIIRDECMFVFGIWIFSYAFFFFVTQMSGDGIDIVWLSVRMGTCSQDQCAYTFFLFIRPDKYGFFSGDKEYVYC